MNSFDKRYGVEMEVMGGALRMSQVASLITAAGVECHVEGYSHSTPRTWKIVSDASLSGPNPMEIVSPILEGTAGLEQIVTICRVLKENGVTVNTSCGLHVHVDARRATNNQMANLLRTWAKYEATVMEVLPPSRRTSRWAKRSFEGMTLDAAFAKIDQQLRYLNRRYGASFADYWSSDRYMALNLVSWSRQGSVEFRSHQGTVEADKITNWVKLCVSMVHRSFRVPDNRKIMKIGAGQFDHALCFVDAKARRFFTARRALFASRSAA